MNNRWMLRVRKIDKNMPRKMGVSQMMLSILANRGITSEKEIDDFLNPDVKKLKDPLLMKDMEKGTDIICSSIDKKEKIAVYGDYDADGITSTYILYNGLLECGADVKYHIPDRVKEGYGININRIEKLKSEGISTIITCDNGISAVEQIERAHELGMKVVITDHHDIPPVIPSADAVINPKQNDCPYPFKMLCGASVAFKFVQSLYRRMGIDERKAIDFIEYAAIGTICDVVDLVGENRIIAQNGIKALNNTKNLGIRALARENSLEIGHLNAYHIGFVLGPCMNAAGRLENAETALKLLMADSAEAANFLASKLRNLNMERQEMTSKGFEEAVEKVENSDLKNDRVLVVYREDIHESIAGIVAGRLKEKYNLPSIVITKGNLMDKGSGRSIEEYNMFEELCKCSDLMENFGGHRMAAGMSIRDENIDELRKRLNDNCSLTEDDLIPKIIIDKRLPLENISPRIINGMKRLEPFGKGNPAPVFAEKNINVFKVYFMGKEGSSVKFFCRLKNSMNKIDAVCFDGSEKFKEIVEKNYGHSKLNRIMANDFRYINMDMIFYPAFNEYNGRRNIQIIVRDFRISAGIR